MVEIGCLGETLVSGYMSCGVAEPKIGTDMEQPSYSDKMVDMVYGSLEAGDEFPFIQPPADDDVPALDDDYWPGEAELDLEVETYPEPTENQRPRHEPIVASDYDLHLMAETATKPDEVSVPLFAVEAQAQSQYQLQAPQQTTPATPAVPTVVAPVPNYEITPKNEMTDQIPIQQIQVCTKSEQDAAQARRAKNTQAARRSRARKADKLTLVKRENELLASRTVSLMYENEQLRAIVKELQIRLADSSNTSTCSSCEKKSTQTTLE